MRCDYELRRMAEVNAGLAGRRHHLGSFFFLKREIIWFLMLWLQSSCSEVVQDALPLLHFAPVHVGVCDPKRQFCSKAR